MGFTAIKSIYENNIESACLRTNDRRHDFGWQFVCGKQSDFTAVPWFAWLLVLYTGIGVTALGRVNDNLKTHVCVFKVTMPKSIRDDFT